MHFKSVLHISPFRFQPCNFLLLASAMNIRTIAWFALVLTAASMAAPVANAEQPATGRLFKAWDTNNDKRLSRSELPAGPRRNFAKVDVDGDGFISPQEHNTFMQRSGRRQFQQQKFAGVQVKADLAYAGGKNPHQTLDLYLPVKPASDTPLPMVAFIHGGGWKNGSKNGGLRQVGRLVESGKFAGASIGYRLSGEAQWPAQIHDCKAAVRWLKANAGKYGYDASKICVFGTSAGGHLVAMLGVTGGVKSLEGELGSHLQQSSRVACVIDFFGPANLLTMNDFPGRLDHNAANSPESQLIGGAIQQHKAKARDASPDTYVTPDDAPVLIMHGTADPLVPFDQSVQFHKLLQKSEVDAVLVPVAGGGHGFSGEAVDKRVDQFLQKHLLGGGPAVSADAITLKKTAPKK